jgi:hypothetical protein
MVELSPHLSGPRLLFHPRVMASESPVSGRLAIESLSIQDFDSI